MFLPLYANIDTAKLLELDRIVTPNLFGSAISH